MLTFEEARAIVQKCSCKIFNQSIGFRFERFEDAEDRWFLQPAATRPDTDNPLKWATGTGAKEYISPHATEDEIVKKCLKLALEFVEHEIREGFFYMDKRIFGPHISVEAMCEIADRVSYRTPMEEFKEALGADVAIPVENGAEALLLHQKRRAQHTGHGY